MKLLIIAREVPDQDLGASYTLMSPDSQEGQQAVLLYGVTQYPAWIVTRSDGSLVQIWQGTEPSRAELSYYMEPPI